VTALNEDETARPAGRGAPNPNRWKALAVLGLFQFMLVLDITVVNIALPRIGHDLSLGAVGLAWVVNAYVLMAAGFLLLGGRLADMLGRRRMFIIGVIVFAVSSIVSGAAVDPGMLIAGRFAQGIGEAIAAPAALGMVVFLFSDPRERIKALGIWGGLSGLGGVSGTVISGVLTDLASWRWIFFINIPVALVAVILIPLIVRQTKQPASRGTLDIGGALLGTAGLIGVVYGLLQIPADGWLSWEVLPPLAIGILLIAAMVLVERRSSSPLVPLHLFQDRVRGVTYLAILLYGATFISYVFLLNLFEQRILDYSPLQGGLSYLPMGAGIGLGIGLGTALMPRLGSRILLGVGLIGVALGLVITSGITPDSSYVGGVLPGMIALGLFSGVIFPASSNAAFHRVDEPELSVAAAVQNVMQQVGGALGLAAFVALAYRHSADLVAAHTRPDTATTDGFTLAFQVAAALLAIVGVGAIVLLRKTTIIARPTA
jgi:EmrB/QacA subfamily drug resistance transporter